MKQIRKSLFETNSSSTHSISIANPFDKECFANDLNTFVNPDDNYLHVEFGEFGWGYEKYNDCYTKLQYLLTLIAEINKRDGYHQKLLSLDDFYLFDEFMLLESIICEKCGCKGICIDSKIETTELDVVSPEGNHYISVYMNGYIDHQSHEDYYSIFDFLDDLSIEQFIFNPQITLIIDNDNH